MFDIPILFQGEDETFPGLLFLVLLLASGHRIVRSAPQLKKVGVNFGAIVFCASTTFDYWNAGAERNGSLRAIAVNSAVLAALATGFAWIVGPAAAAACTFVKRGISIAVRGFVMIVVGVACAFVATCKSIVRIFGLPIERRRDLHRQEELRRSRLAADDRAQAAAEEQHRRKEARSQCELFYSLYRSDLGKRFTRSMFDGYIEKYMSDADPADVVERRGIELRGIIESQLERIGKAERPTSIDQLALWYVREKERIDALEIPEDVKDEYRMMLETRHADISTEILERLHP